jgi:cytidine deaminase
MKKTSRTPAWQKAVNRFEKRHRDEIDRIWDNGGVLPAEAVARLVSSPAEIGRLMMQLLPLAKQYAAAPVSRYQVGAVAAGMPKRAAGWCSLYLGANFEFRNAALSFTTHAEQAAVNNAWLRGERGIQMLAVSAAPCGYCRQFLYELVTAPRLLILVRKQKDALAYHSAPLTTFLPDAFGPNELKVTGGLMDPKLCSHKLALESSSRSDSVVAAALEAASRSYAPYSTGKSFNYAAVAVQLADGAVYAGRHAENAAYNPSLSPLQSAFAFMNMARPAAAANVKRCVLVEVPTLASQRSATQAALVACAPTAELEYYAARIAR